MQLEPIIEEKEKVELVGMERKMSLVEDKTAELWREFMSRRREIEGVVGEELYSVQVFGEDYFEKFRPEREFEKWAALVVSEAKPVEGMESLVVPAGRYAVFEYRGRASEVGGVMKWILGEWLPVSGYVLDQRPHLAVMGERYKNEDPDSEEELWIPVKRR